MSISASESTYGANAVSMADFSSAHAISFFSFRMCPTYTLGEIKYEIGEDFCNGRGGKGMLSSHLGVFFFIEYIYLSNLFLRTIHDHNKAGKREAEDVREYRTHICFSKESQQCVYYNKQYPYFGWPDAKVMNFECIGGGKCEKAVYHKCTEYNKEGKEMKRKRRWKDKGIGNQNGTQKYVIKEMIHIIAPFYPAGVLVLAERSVKRVREPL